jgi:hypothetical protein
MGTFALSGRNWGGRQDGGVPVDDTRDGGPLI